jgi:hypothetical protein
MSAMPLANSGKPAGSGVVATLGVKVKEKTLAGVKQSLGSPQNPANWLAIVSVTGKSPGLMPTVHSEGSVRDEGLRTPPVKSP